MSDNKTVNLCKTCWNFGECMENSICEKSTCDKYKAMSPEELAERDKFVNSIFVGECLFCGSENTSCGIDPEDDETDFTIASCEDCGKHWCTECGYQFAEVNQDTNCPHWKICEDCSEENGYLDTIKFGEQFCTQCEHQDEENGCNLDDPSYCPNQEGHVCPHEADVTECAKIKQFLKKKRSKK